MTAEILRPVRWLVVVVAVLVFALAMAAGVFVKVTDQADRTRDVQLQVADLAVQTCLQLEDVKAGIREQAQATIDGDLLLLQQHDETGVPLPVPREAVEADIAAKQKTINRYPPRDCGRPTE